MADDVRSLPILTREMVLDRAALARRAEGDDRVPMSLSSEYAVERGGFWSEPFMEVLDHSREAIDLSRTEGGLPLLLDHDPTKQIGLVEDVEIGADKVLRGMARFSRNPLAQEVKRDVEDGIKTRTSIGYRVREMEQEKRADKNELAVMRATRWQLYENSIVSIPADPTVGVGRSVDEATHPVVIRTLDPLPTTPAPQARSHTVSDQNTAPAGAAPATVSDRGEQIIDLCELAGFPHRAGEFLRSNKSLDAIKAELRTAKAQAAQTAIENAPAPQVEEYEAGREFSIGKAIRAQMSGNWKDAGYERAVSQNEAKRLGLSSDGKSIFMPTLRKLTEQEIATRTSHSVSSNANGGYSVFSEYAGFIDLLRKKALLGRLGATVLPGLQGNVTFPRQITAGTAYWMGEISGADVTESNVTLDQVALSPKTLMARQSYSNQLLAQSSINIDALVRDDLAKILGLELDRAGFHGTGAANQPTGIYGMSGINSKAFGGAISYDTALDMVTEIAADDADIGDIAFAMTPEAVNKAAQTQRFSSTDTPLYTGTFAAGQLIGYRAEVSNQLSKVMLNSAATGGSEHGILCGVWSQYLIGEWGALQLTVDPYTLAGQDVVRLIARLFVDMDVRHPESFCKGTGQTV
jgi:HK97 family phage major capsid protein/HK97 family phage prohead protease